MCEEFAEAGEVKMWSACLLNAMQEYHGMILVDNKKPAKKDIQEASKQWFLSDNDGIGSFLYVCQVIGLNPDKALERIDDPETIDILKRARDAKRRQNI